MSLLFRIAINVIQYNKPAQYLKADKKIIVNSIVYMEIIQSTLKLGFYACEMLFLLESFKI